MSPDPDRAHRVLIFAPAGRDAELARGVLEAARITALVCSTLTVFCRELEAGAAAGILSEAAILPERRAPLVELLAAQPTWADFPLVIVAPRVRGEDARIPLERALRELGNTTLLERPLHPETLLNAVRAALRGREKQYQSRELLLQLEKAVRDRDRFLATLSHELRNPLGAIRSAVAIMSHAVARGASVERPMAIVDRQVTHLARLVDDLLDVSRVTSGKVSLVRESIDLRVVVAHVISQFEQAFAARDLALASSVGAWPLWVIGDAVRLEQVVTNLLTNSLKYTPEGGRVDVSTGRDGDEVWVRVHDTGVGIERGMLDAIFDMFSQADRSLARSQGGMGIGLTLVKALVELHGGSVEASSPGLGRGSEFTVRLPAATETASGVTNEVPAPEQPRRTRQRLLLVEDNDDNREMLRELLESDGFEVDVARDGPEGVQRALETRPDAAIVDIGLPLLDGYEVARQVRAALGPRIQLVALTGYGQPEDRQRTLEAGFDAHLTKPVHLEELEMALAEGA